MGPSSPEPLPGALGICLGVSCSEGQLHFWSLAHFLLEVTSLQPPSLFPFDLGLSCPTVDKLGRNVAWVLGKGQMWGGPGKEIREDTRLPGEPTAPTPHGVLGGQGMGKMALGSFWGSEGPAGLKIVQ